MCKTSVWRWAALAGVSPCDGRAQLMRMELGRSWPGLWAGGWVLCTGTRPLFGCMRRLAAWCMRHAVCSSSRGTCGVQAPDADFGAFVDMRHACERPPAPRHFTHAAVPACIQPVAYLWPADSAYQSCFYETFRWGSFLKITATGGTS